MIETLKKYYIEVNTYTHTKLFDKKYYKELIYYCTLKRNNTMYFEFTDDWLDIIINNLKIEYELNEYSISI